MALNVFIFSCTMTTTIHLPNSFCLAKLKQNFWTHCALLFISPYAPVPCDYHSAFCVLWIWSFWVPHISGLYGIFSFVTGIFFLTKCPESSSMLYHASEFPSLLWLNNIPLYVYITFVDLFICPRTLGLFPPFWP